MPNAMPPEIGPNAANNTFFGLIGLQARIIAAMVLRETRATFGTTKLGYLWAIIVPAAGIGVLMAIFTLAGRSAPYGTSLALFFSTGVLTLELFRKLSNTLMTTFDANKSLLTYPLIKATDALFARLILITATYLLIMTVAFSGLVAAGLAPPPAHPAVMMYAFLSTALLGFGFGVTNAVIMSLWASWRQIESVITRPLFFISGIFYVPSLLPPEATNLLKWNPVLHLVEWMRLGYYPRYTTLILDQSYPLALGFGLTFTGLLGERIFRKKRT